MRTLHLIWVALIAALGALALPASALAVAQIHQHDDGLRDYDARSGAIAPTDVQRSAVKRLRANATWNRFGTPATLRLVVETNQCTGGSHFQGDQDADPVNNSDCDSNTAANLRFVRAAELQAFSTAGSVNRFGD